MPTLQDVIGELLAPTEQKPPAKTKKVDRTQEFLQAYPHLSYLVKSNQPTEPPWWQQHPGSEHGARFLGMIEPGTIDPYDRPHVPNPEGGPNGYSTLRTITIAEDGQTILLPTVINGRLVTPQEAIQSYHKTGQHLGKFSSESEAEKYDEYLHSEIQRISQSQPLPTPAPSKV